MSPARTPRATSPGATLAMSSTRHTQFMCRSSEGDVVPAHHLDRGRTGECFDPAHIGRARALAHNLEQADLGRAPDVRSPAELAGERSITNLHHPDDIPVLLSEQ